MCVEVKKGVLRTEFEMKYTQKELENMLAEFRSNPAEPPWLEFKTGLKDPDRKSGV